MKIFSFSLPRYNLLNHQNISKSIENTQKPLQLELFRTNGQKYEKQKGDDSTIDRMDIDFTPSKVGSNDIKEINKEIGKIAIKEAAITKDIDRLSQLLEMMSRITSYDTYVPTIRVDGELKDINKEIARLKKDSVISDSTKDGSPKENILRVKDVIDVPLQYFESEAYGYVRYEIGNSSGKRTLVGNDKSTGLGEVAERLNRFYGNEGVSASAEVVFKPFTDPSRAIKAGKTPSNFSINDVIIGEVTLKNDDRDGALANAINSKIEKTGVIAGVDGVGLFYLKSIDGRAIKISGDLQKLAKLNIVDEDKIIKYEPIMAKALFKLGDTLTNYEFDLGRAKKINTIKIRDYDGDGGYYNVYVINGDRKTLVGENIEASGNNEYKTNTLVIDLSVAEKISIKPLDRYGKEDGGGSLGGLWEVMVTDVQRDIDALIMVGKLTVQQENTINYVTSEDLPYFTENKTREITKEANIANSEMATAEDVKNYKDVINKKLSNLKDMLTKTIEEKREKLSSLEQYIPKSTFDESSFEPSRAVEIVKGYGKSFVEAQWVRSINQVNKLLFDKFDFSFNTGVSGAKKSGMSKMFSNK